jgi:hypothetical protein
MCEILSETLGNPYVVTLVRPGHWPLVLVLTHPWETENGPLVPLSYLE